MNSRQSNSLKSFFDENPKVLLWKGDAAEFVSNPTPMTASIVLEILNRSENWQSALELINCPLSIHFTDEYLKVLLHHSYVDLSVESELLGRSKTSAWKFPDEFTKPQFQASLWDVLRNPRYAFWQAKILQLNILSQTVARLEQEEKLFYENLRGEVQAEGLRNKVQILHNAFSFVLAMSFLDGVCQQYFKQFISKRNKVEQERLSHHLAIQTREHDEYFRSLDQLRILKADSNEIEKYIAQYGMRSFDDYELSSPRYWEIPEKILQIAKSNTNKQNTEENIVDDQLRVGDKELVSMFGKIKGLRGSFRLHLLVIINQVRQTILELAVERKVSADLVFFLSVTELTRKEKLPTEVDLLIRKKEYEEDRSLNLPMVLTAKNWNQSQSTSEREDSILVLSVSHGNVIGIVQQINSELDIVQSKGNILILPDSSPRYTHLYPQASGIVFKQGGLMSHGAIIAREYRIPAVSLSGKRIEIEDGKKVSLNASAGSITLLS